MQAQLVSTHGSDNFRIGVAGYNFRQQDLDKSLAFLHDLGVKYMSVKDFQLPMNATPADVAALKAKMAGYDIDGYCLGPIYMRSKEEVDKTFEYAKQYDFKLLIGVPNYDLIPYVEQKVKEYDIPLAIHTHGPDSAPFPDAEEVMKYVGKLDKRMGICMDLGHTVRYGKNCIDHIRKYSDRIFDIHIKDVTEPSKAGKTCPMGRGVMDIPAIVKALKAVGYKGVLTLEYEPNPENPFPAISESIGYLRGVCDALK